MTRPGASSQKVMPGAITVMIRARPTSSIARPPRTVTTASKRWVKYGADAGSDDDRRTHRDQPDAHLDRAQASGALQEHREHDDQAELAHRQDAGRDEPVAETAVPEATELDQRVSGGPFLPSLDHDERGEQHQGDEDHDGRRREPDRLGPQREAPDGERLLGRPPAVGAALAEGEHQQEHPARQQERAGDVEAGSGWSPVVRPRPEQHDPRHRARGDDDVDREPESPGELRGEEATEQRTECGADAHGGAEHREGGGPVATAEAGRDHGHRRGEHQARADPLDQRFPHEQARHRPGEGGHQRTDREEGAADGEHAAVPVEVAQAAADDEQRARTRASSR